MIVLRSCCCMNKTYADGLLSEDSPSSVKLRSGKTFKTPFFVEAAADFM